MVVIISFSYPPSSILSSILLPVGILSIIHGNNAAFINFSKEMVYRVSTSKKYGTATIVGGFLVKYKEINAEPYWRGLKLKE